MKKYIVIAMIGILAHSSSMAQNRNTLDKETEAIVLKTVYQLVNDSNYSKLGFASVAEARNLTIGTGLPISIVPLDKLKTLDSASGSLQTIKLPSQSALYPLINARSQQPVALVNIEMKEGKATVRGIGNNSLAAAIKTTSANLSPDMQRSAELVRIPALQLDFLSVTDQGTHYYLALTTIADLQIEKGARLTDQSLLTKVLPLARRYNGLPW
jgi:hypothetical protein